MEMVNTTLEVMPGTTTTITTELAESTSKTYYYYVAGAIVVGVLLLYYISLKLSENSWTERPPPGPLHIPGIGSLLYILRFKDLSHWLDGLLSTYGQISRCCLPRKKLVVVRHDAEFESMLAKLGEMKEATVNEYIFKMLLSIGVRLKVTELVVSECSRLSKIFYNYTVSTKDFEKFMENAEDYRASLNMKKTEELLGKILGKQIVLEKTEKDLISVAFHEVDKFKDDFLKSSPAGWLHGTYYFPHVHWERKRLFKTMQKIERKLSEVFYKFDGSSDEQFSQFLALYVMMGLAKTSPRKTFSTRQKTTGTDLDKTPDGIVVVEKVYQPTFDIVGLRFFTTKDYVEIFKFVIPPHSLLVSYDTR